MRHVTRRGSGKQSLIRYSRSFSRVLGTRQSHVPVMKPDRMNVLPRLPAEILDRVQKYDFATVADLYDMLGETGEYTDNRWGWTDLSKADVIRVHQGYLLDLPRPEPID